MKLGIDIHGVLDRDPELVRAFLFCLKSNGAEIHIMSGPSMDDILAELDACGMKWGVHYDEIFSVVDYLKKKGARMWQDDDGDWWADDKDWWDSKGEYCREKGIDMVIDDSPKYIPAMPTECSFILIEKKVDDDV